METLRIANGSGFWGDRLSAAAEMVRGGPIDVLTGDYLAELSMALLDRRRRRDPTGGFVPTFLAQMEEVLGECLARGIRVVSNAGGLAPERLAEALSALAARLGLKARIAWVDGDDLMPRLEALRAAGEPFTHLDDGRPLAASDRQILTANAYLGGWGIKEALDRGADVVVTGRVTDAALVVGPSAWRFGWRRDDWDRLAGAVAAGHVLECSAQATGGNYSFPEEIPSLSRIGFPLCEMREDGSFVVTKHPGTGGRVSVGTVTAQLLYEIQGPRYLNPDVTARFDSLRVAEIGPDRVEVTGARGEPPPPTLKVCLHQLGGWRNTMNVLLGGAELGDKARRVVDGLFDALGGREQFDLVDLRLDRLVPLGLDGSAPPAAGEEPASWDEALAYLKITVFAKDKALAGRRFADAVVALALASVPGFSSRTPPGDAQPVYVHWPALLDRRQVTERLHLDGETFDIAPPPDGAAAPFAPPPPPPAPALDGPTERVPLGRIAGARSGDKGGTASLGLWCRDDEAYAFLVAKLTAEGLAALCPDLAAYPIRRALLPNLRALLFEIPGLLGEGVASSTRSDPQAKVLAEYVRARRLEVPSRLLR